MKYGYTKELKKKVSFSEALENTKFALMEEGFGVLSEIDIQDAMKKKLDKDIDQYVILGACNPSLAYKALEVELEIGLLLPCNVIIYEKNAKIFIAVIVPTIALKVVGKKALTEIALEAETKLIKAIDSI